MSRKKFASSDDEVKILNKCPLCGEKLEYNSLFQYTNVYEILANGKLSKKRKRKEDSGSMECGFISCTNKNCDFSTDCDLDVLEHKEIRVFQDSDIFKYTIDD